MFKPKLVTFSAPSTNNFETFHSNHQLQLCSVHPATATRWPYTHCYNHPIMSRHNRHCCTACACISCSCCCCFCAMLSPKDRWPSFTSCCNCSTGQHKQPHGTSHVTGLQEIHMHPAGLEPGSMQTLQHLPSDAISSSFLQPRHILLLLLYIHTASSPACNTLSVS